VSYTSRNSLVRGEATFSFFFFLGRVEIDQEKIYEGSIKEVT